MKTNFYKKIITDKSDSGFTIVELIVAMGLFMVLITMVSGVFLRSIRTQRAVVGLIAANSNAQLAIEQMAREMRTGSVFSISGPDDNIINFTNAKDEAVAYSWDSADKSLKRSANGVEEKITADNVSVEKANFILLSDNSYPARITVIMKIGANNLNKGDEAFINIQTTVSSRTL